MATLAGIMRDPIKTPYRKAYMKRRQVADGLYEASWLDITDYVTSWGTLQTAVDDVNLNRFTHAGINLQVKNEWGQFNPEWDGGSLFYGYLTRYRTLIKIEAGYTDGAGNSFPTTTTQGIYILDGEIRIDPHIDIAMLNCKSIISPFEETRADEIGGITASITSSEILEKIKDSTDGSGNYLFQNFITASAWNIQSTTNIITELGTTTSLEQYSVWELMNKLAELEGYVVHATREGNLVFGDRLPNTTSSQFSFYGAGFRRPNIIKINDYKEAVNKLYNNIRFKYLEADTSTSYVNHGTTTTIGPANDEWTYGRRTYELENTFFTDSSTVNDIVRIIHREASNLRSELHMDIIFHPSIELLDRVDVSYREGSINSIHLWDYRNWAADTSTADVEPVLYWASETSSAIDFNQKNFKVLSRKTNLDNFTTSLILREAEN